MNLLVIGHSFVKAYNQKKYVAMKQLGVNVRLLVPSLAQDRFGPTPYEVHPAFCRDEVIPLRSWFVRSHMTYLQNPRHIAAMVRSFHPHVIHIDEEPQALITMETVALRPAVAPDARVTLFSWDNLLRRRHFPLNLLKRSMRAYALRRVDAVICGNRRAAELVRAERRFLGTIEVLPQYGLDAAEHWCGNEPELRAKLGLDKNIIISFIGRLVPEKGLQLLIDALGRLQSMPWKLLLVGAGSLEEEIRHNWITRFPGRILLLPAVPYEKVPQYLRCSDIFVLPSYSTPRWIEQYGLTLTQAMMLGIPSVGSSSGAIPEVLGSGGIIFDEGSTEQLASALEELMISPSRREQLGRLGREFALKHYTQEGVAARYLAAFERVLSSNSRIQAHNNELSAVKKMAEPNTPAKHTYVE
jgi:glycosyltransferase involved in cell wall biosynthesis